jgi:hypothetical protein
MGIDRLRCERHFAQAAAATGPLKTTRTEEFKRSALPVDFKSTTPPLSVVADLDKRPFVRQLRRINVGPARVENAIRDYYRASEQRSRWAREDLLIDGELKIYEQELVEAWQPRFASMPEELTPTCTPQKRVKLAKACSMAPCHARAQRVRRRLSNLAALAWSANLVPNPGSNWRRACHRERRGAAPAT